MTFKYLAPNLSPEDARRIYRAFAKLLHPDAAGGNKEEFQKLQQEYETLQNNSNTASSLNAFSDDILERYTMSFGKYRGCKISDIPLSYCQWLLDNATNLTTLMESLLKKRISHCWQKTDF
ncbi:MAG: putative quorum-sensing-regulated virulence factor [Bacteroidales bacterium]